MRDDWRREKMEKLIKDARAEAVARGETVAIIKESALDFQIVGINETAGKNVIQYISSGN